MDDRFNIKGFIPVSLLDWPGMITSVIFLGGCGFRCPACHNRDLVLDHATMPNVAFDRVLSHVSRRNSWIDGVTITGGEPTCTNRLSELISVFKSRGLKIKIDTNGSNPHILERLISWDLPDAVAMDVKAPLTAEEYSRVAGVPVNPRTIARSIDILKASGLLVTFRTTVIPGLVEEPEVARIRRYLGDVPHYLIQAFRNVGTLNPSFRDLPPFSPGRIDRMRMMFESPVPAQATGFGHAYAG